MPTRCGLAAPAATVPPASRSATSGTPAEPPRASGSRARAPIRAPCGPNGRAGAGRSSGVQNLPSRHLASLISGLVLTFGALAPSTALARSELTATTVVRVVDGDTVDVQFEDG